MSHGGPADDAANPGDADDAVDAAVDDDQPAPDAPAWDDEYFDRVADTLRFNYDLERDRRVDGERYALYGQLRMENHKQFIHPSINYANHSVEEHVFARRADRLTVADLDDAVAFGHDLADDWLDPDEEHQRTDFTFVFVVPELTDDVRSRVAGFRDRTLIKYGYYGHYEVNLVVVAPDEEAHVASDSADVWRAFAPWADDEDDAKGGRILGRLSRLLRR
ncbi:hypothetical protein [Halobaculum sp. D14]|uniref:hypothetical protein n=1 Tax=Halobaculum sp. D14 TaxID=3421642 RepID=UPI003EBA5768